MTQIKSLINVHVMSLSSNEKGFCYSVYYFQVKKIKCIEDVKRPKTP